MSASRQALQSQAETLRKKIAAGEAGVQILRDKLAKIEAKLGGGPAPVTGLDLLWKAALKTSRMRSSKAQCRAQWNRIPLDERPTVQVAIDALKAWNRCEEWKKDGNRFAPGLHLFIQHRKWEDLPEEPRASARYVTIPKPLPKTDPDEAVTDRAEIARLLGIKPPRMNS